MTIHSRGKAPLSQAEQSPVSLMRLRFMRLMSCAMACRI